MFTKTKANVPVSKIAKFLGIKFTGRDFNIKGVTSLDSLKDSHLLFFTEMINLTFNLKEEKKFKFSKLKKYSNVLMITNKENASKIPCLKFLSKNPRLDFEKVLKLAAEVGKEEKVLVQMHVGGDPGLFWKLRYEMKKRGHGFVEAPPVGGVGDRKDRR